MNYGGLDVAEAIRTGRIAELADSDHAPHIEHRGLKLNVPLDLRTPSYPDPSDAAQANIPEMWSNYAAKIRGACELALYDKTSDTLRQANAVRELERALLHWKHYSAACTRQYVQPVLYNRTGWVDIPKLTDNAAAHIALARNWRPGAIEDAKIKRSGTEAGFRK